MPFDFGAHQARVIELLRDAAPLGTSPENDDFVQACIGAGHRQQFFIDIGSALKQRGQTIYRAIEAHGLVPARGKPGKPQCQALCKNRPTSLSGALKLDNALTAIANHALPDVSDVTKTSGVPLILTADSIIASVYYGNPSKLLELRVSKYGSNRNAASMAIFGPGRYDVWRQFELGLDNKYPRITRATLDKIADVLGDEAYEIFTHDPHAGPGEGEKTFALPLSHGNHLHYVRRAAA